MVTPRVWLVTGASSGFGKSLTNYVLAKGDVVVATLRQPEMLQELSENYSKDKLLVLKVDVMNQTDIDYAFAQTKEAFGRLDVVFNNAGYSVFGNAETTPIDIARSLFEVNFWGAVNVSRAAVRFFREVNEPGRGGVLLQNSSIAGVEGFPGLPFYCASKQALDGFSEALAQEILPQWNIKICIIQAGRFKTSMSTNSKHLPDDPVYKDKVAAFAASSGSKLVDPKYLGDPTKFAKTIYSLIEVGNMPLHLLMGLSALDIAENKMKSLKREISEAASWNEDLLCDDI